MRRRRLGGDASVWSAKRRQPRRFLARVVSRHRPRRPHHVAHVRLRNWPSTLVAFVLHIHCTHTDVFSSSFIFLFVVVGCSSAERARSLVAIPPSHSCATTSRPLPPLPLLLLLLLLLLSLLCVCVYCVGVSGSSSSPSRSPHVSVIRVPRTSPSASTVDAIDRRSADGQTHRHRRRTTTTNNQPTTNNAIAIEHTHTHQATTSAHQPSISQ